MEDKVISHKRLYETSFSMHEMVYNPLLIPMDLEGFETISKRKKTMMIMKIIQIHVFYIVDRQPFLLRIMIIWKAIIWNALYTLVPVTLRYFYTKVFVLLRPLFTPIGMGTKRFVWKSAFK